MPIPRSASMMPPLRRSRSASMSSLAQVDLSTLDPDVVLDYARKVSQLQPQPATSSEKMQMLFALSQKLMKWFLEDRERLQKQLDQECCNLLNSNTLGHIKAAIPPLHIQKVVPQSGGSPLPKDSDKLSVASRILASAVVPVAMSDIKPAIILDNSAKCEDVRATAQNFLIRPAEAEGFVNQNEKRELSNLQVLSENEPLVDVLPTPNSALPTTQVSKVPPRQKADALQLYLQVQRSVICMQKYARGYLARRRFFRVLEELLRGHEESQQ